MSGGGGGAPGGPGPRAVVLGAAGVLLFAVIWEALGRLKVLGPSWPPLSRVAATLADPANHPLFLRALGATASEAALGYAIGVTGALVCASLAVVVPRSSAPIGRLALILNSVPVIALGPLINAVLPRWVTPIAVATIAVSFTMFIAVLAGLEAAGQSHHDLLTVLGATPWVRFRRLQCPAALPSIADGLKLGAPAAVLGAIIGEWFGAERGIGPLLVSSMQNYRIDQLWAAALLGALGSMVAYGVLALFERAVSGRYR